MSYEIAIGGNGINSKRFLSGETLDRLEEVVVDESYIPWVLDHKFRLLEKSQSKSQTFAHTFSFFLASHYLELYLLLS